MTRSLGQTYKNVRFIKAALSTWTSTSKSFGFDTEIYYESDPVSYFKFNLTIIGNSQFVRIGFAVLIVC